MKLILLTTDLMLASSAQHAADRRQIELVAASNADAALAACRDPAVGLLVIDLRLPSLVIETLVPAVRSAVVGTLRILACGPHVHEASLASARAAGCDEVVTRGEFDRRLEAAVQKLG